MKTRLLVWGMVGAAALAVLGFYAFLRTYEPTLVSVREEPTPEARRNPHRVAMRFLERLGWRTALQPPLVDDAALPPPGDLLVLTAGRETLSADWQQRLEDWMRAGGRLVVAAQWQWAEALPTSADQSPNPHAADQAAAEKEAEEDRPRPDAFLQRFGVRAVRVGAEPACWRPWHRQLFDLHIPQAADFLQVNLYRGIRLHAHPEAGAEVLAADDLGAAALRLPVGRGWLTVLTDNGLFNNKRLAEWNHAALLAALAWDAPRVWFAHDGRLPPLPLWLWQQAPLLLISLAGWLALWLWRAMPRFGPVRDRPPPVRRSLLEHVEASARFVWRTDQAAALLASLRQSLQTAWRRRSASPLAAAALAAYTALPRATIATLLQLTTTRDRAAFTQAVRQYQALLARLSGAAAARRTTP